LTISKDKVECSRKNRSRGIEGFFGIGMRMEKMMFPENKRIREKKKLKKKLNKLNKMLKNKRS